MMRNTAENQGLKTKDYRTISEDQGENQQRKGKTRGRQPEIKCQRNLGSRESREKNARRGGHQYQEQERSQSNEIQ